MLVWALGLALGLALELWAERERGRQMLNLDKFAGDRIFFGQCESHLIVSSANFSFSSVLP